MLNALEEDPDEKHRWRRFAIGAGVAVGVTSALLYSANQYAPTRELLSKVVQMTVAAPPPEPDKPLPPLPPPPPPKKQPKQQDKEAAAKKSPSPKPDANPQKADPSQVGMDSQSFAEGGGGPGFHVGGNQMGDPNKIVAAALPKPAPVAEIKKPRAVKFLIAKPLKKGSNTEALFNARARKLGLAGLMAIEVDLDERGRVKSAKTRKGLEAQFDREVAEWVKREWEFEPPRSTGLGEAVASVRIVRVRFNLEK